MEEINVLPFGKKIQVGNYTVLKINKTLTKNQLRAVRENKEIPAEIRKQITRAGIPYMKVEANSQIWGVEMACNTAMYQMIDHLLPIAIIAHETNNEDSVDTTVADFAHLFSMWFTDTTVKGDIQYIEDKGNALKALIERQKALKTEKESTEEKEADDKVLKEVEQNEQTKAAIVDMANGIAEKEKGGTE